MSRHRNLTNEIDRIFGVFRDNNIKIKLLEAAEKDLCALFPSQNDDLSQVLIMFNQIFKKKSRLMSKKVISKYKEILKYYDLNDLEISMNNALVDEFHLENGHKYCTLEYFSRLDQIDKWVNVKKVESKESFVLPTFNIKE
jgi:hypothetical protein